METQVVKACKAPNCKRPYRAKGYCQIHFKKWRRGEMPKKPRYKTCKEENCKKPMVRWGLCEPHYQTLMTVPETPKGEPKKE